MRCHKTGIHLKFSSKAFDLTLSRSKVKLWRGKLLTSNPSYIVIHYFNAVRSYFVLSTQRTKTLRCFSKKQKQLRMFGYLKTKFAEPLTEN